MDTLENKYENKINDFEEKLYAHLAFIYGELQAENLVDRLKARLERFRQDHPNLAAASPRERVSEKDSILITYGDMLREAGTPPLKTLAQFLQEYLADSISTVHLLPFYPYSSDDGFAVIDYRRVNSDLGTWEHITGLGENFRLMFDAVINHISAQSPWFRGFLNGDPAYQEYFTVVEEGVDLARVFRPRATPVLTPFETPSGEKRVWTTFSADQIDLNYRSPDVLLEVIDLLLFYVAQGAEFIRLDAVTYVWKEIGTTSINMPRTHRIVQLLRTVLDIAAPRVAIITETNVPHIDNIAYFGDGTDEAQLVYNFALPLLTLHAFHKADVSTLSEWAETLDLPSDQSTFFNFLACHDGIGIMPVRDILSQEDLDELITHTQELGGYVSYKSNEDGSQSPYELNINYLDALSPSPDIPEELTTTARRFLASQAIMLALRGVPGIYFHSLFGSRNWRAGVEHTGRCRTINREKLHRAQLEDELADENSLRYRVFRGYHQLLKARRASPAFHPNGGQAVLNSHPSVFSVLRTSLDGRDRILCLINVSNQGQELTLGADKLPLGVERAIYDLLSKSEYRIESGRLQLNISPYQVLWLQL